MRPQRIYIDTSVVGGCNDEEFAEDSLRLFDLARDRSFSSVVSEVLARELESAPPHVRALLAELPQDMLESVARSEESTELQQAYLADGVLGSSSADDALHVALATIAGAGLVVSGTSDTW